MDNPKLKYLEDVPWDNSLKLSDGKTIHSLEQLPVVLMFCDDDVFDSHVNFGKNDFANWIRDVIGYRELADKISGVRSKDEFLKLMEQGINDIKNNTVTEPESTNEFVKVVEAPVIVPEPVRVLESTPMPVQSEPIKQEQPPTPLPVQQVVQPVVAPIVQPEVQQTAPPVVQQIIQSQTVQPIVVQSVVQPEVSPIVKPEVQQTVQPQTVQPVVVQSPVTTQSVIQPIKTPETPTPTPIVTPAQVVTPVIQSVPITEPVVAPVLTPIPVSIPASIPAPVTPAPTTENVVATGTTPIGTVATASTTAGTATAASTPTATTTTEATSDIIEEIFDFEEIFTALITELDQEVLAWDTQTS